MQVLRAGVAQQMLQGDLSGGVVEQVGASDKMSDTLRCIIGDYCQLVGIKRPATPDNKITNAVADVFSNAAVHRVFERNIFVIYYNA